jgi:hypothetical protein
MWQARLLFFAWFPMPDLSSDFDKRYRATKAYRSLHRYARWLQFWNTIFFVRAYVGLTMRVLGVGVPSSIGKYADLDPSDVTTLVGLALPTSLPSIGWTLFQGWGTGLLLFELLLQLAKLAPSKTSA